MFKSHDKEYYIQIFYRTEGDDYPKASEIPHCGKKCDLDKFRDLYRDIIPDDFERECGSDDRNQEVGETDETDEFYDSDDSDDDDIDENDY